jgi:hypothetical protein
MTFRGEKKDIAAGNAGGALRTGVVPRRMMVEIVRPNGEHDNFGQARSLADESDPHAL